MVTIENHTGRPLPGSILKLLEKMFANYERAVLKSEFTEGLSGSRVFMVRAIRHNSPELPTVVKIDTQKRIEQEYRAYENYIQYKLPRIANIHGTPVHLLDNSHSGLRYELVGNGTFDVESFHTYYQKSDTADIEYVLEQQLFKSLNTLWRNTSERQPELQWQTVYASILPSDLPTRVAAALGSHVDVTAETLTLANGTSLPNPLAALQGLLNHSLDVYVAHTHGDLNLQNILVERQNRNAYLIDFYKSGKTHVIRDLLHLETAVITKLVPEALAKASLAPEAIVPFYERLHCSLLLQSQIQPPPGLEKPFEILRTIRQAAHRLLFNPESWQEYQYGLIFYLLGSFRYDDLNKIPGAKQVAFWGAAVILKTLGEQLRCKEIAIKGVQSEEVDITVSGMYLLNRESKGKNSEASSIVIGNQTIINAPIYGPLLSGSGSINMDAPQPASENKNRKIISTRQLREKLIYYFSISEIKDIAFDLGVDYENLAGATKNDIVRELINLLQRQGRLTELMEIVLKLRPHASWTEVWESE